MNALKKLSVIVLTLLAFGPASAQSPQLLNASDFEKKLEATKNKIILDVRTQSEYDQGHLVNATLIDYYKNDFKQQLGKLDKNKPVFVYCAAGGRSGSAIDILTDLGFKKIYDLQGGMRAWSNFKKPIVK